MTSQHRKHGIRLFSIGAAILGLVLGLPMLALASGYGHGGAHHATNKTSPHGSGAMGHGKAHSGGSMHGGHGMKGGMHGRGGHGMHQSASKFIDHILKFKDGMAINRRPSDKTSIHQNRIRKDQN